jgi:hypothetical protein
VAPVRRGTLSARLGAAADQRRWKRREYWRQATTMIEVASSRDNETSDTEMKQLNAGFPILHSTLE